MVAQTDVIEGKVARVNPNGFRVVGRDRWFNLSRYGERPPLPLPGQWVKAAVDERGFLQSVEVVPAELSTGVGAQAVTAPESNPGATASHPDKDMRITRLAVLNTATALLSSGGRRADGDAVIALAARFEGWVTR